MKVLALTCHDWKSIRKMDIEDTLLSVLNILCSCPVFNLARNFFLDLDSRASVWDEAFQTKNLLMAKSLEKGGILAGGIRIEDIEKMILADALLAGRLIFDYQFLDFANMYGYWHAFQNLGR